MKNNGINAINSTFLRVLIQKSGKRFYLIFLCSNLKKRQKRYGRQNIFNVFHASIHYIA